MTQGRFLADSVTQSFVVNDVIASDQPRQVEGFGWSIKGDGSHPGIFRNRLGRNVLMTCQIQIRPDFIRNHINIMFPKQFHGFFKFPAFPCTTGWVVGTAKNRCVDLLFHQFLFHILIVHAPHIVFITNQWTVHQLISCISKGICKSYISWRMHQDLISFGAKNSRGTNHPSKNSVFITNAFRS